MERPVIAADEPITCAIYAQQNELPKEDGWRQFKIAKREKILLRQVKANLRSFMAAPKYMHGYEVPRNFLHAIELDNRNGNTKWKDSTNLEMELREHQKGDHPEMDTSYLLDDDGTQVVSVIIRSLAMVSIIATNGHHTSCHDFVRFQDCTTNCHLEKESSVFMGISHSSKTRPFISENEILYNIEKKETTVQRRSGGRTSSRGANHLCHFRPAE